MGRDKSRDDKYFNCSEEYEHTYVANLYPGFQAEVLTFLKQKCANNTKNYTNNKKFIY